MKVRDLKFKDMRVGMKFNFNGTETSVDWEEVVNISDNHYTTINSRGQTDIWPGRELTGYSEQWLVEYPKADLFTTLYQKLL